MEMVEEVRLLDSLQQRLSDLEHKVRAYRHDRVLDFQRYYHDLLRDVPPAVTSSVRQSLAQSLSDYPLLGSDIQLDLQPSPDITHSQDPQLADSRIVAYPESGQRHTSSLPMTASHTGFEAGEPSGSPHDHERELQGLFTPTYLPLLEASPNLPRSPPAVPLPPSPAAMLLPEPGITGLGQGAGIDQRGSSPLTQGFLSGGAQSPSRPPPVRRSTDDTTSSGVSDRSDTKVPRSALRRSSSASRPPQSPRRVRFEFQGAEVLPTASPQPTDFITPHASSPDTSTEIVASSSMLDDEEEYAPPRKISSSEALRALSRAPLDEGTVWTVVNSNPDDIIVQQEDLKPIDSDSSPSGHFMSLPAAPDPPPSAPRPMPIRTSPRLGSLSEEPEEDLEEEEEEDSSDEEFLSMAKPKSFTNKKTPNSPSLIQPTKAAAPSSPTSVGKGSSSEPKSVSFASPDESDIEEDDMFHFETGGNSAPSKRRSQPLPIEEDDNEDEDVSAEDASATAQQSLYATSPAVSIARQHRSGPTTPTRTKFQAGSLGSYKGRPVIMPVVRNPEVHAQAASLGQFNTFVGGLDGRSGMDEGDLSSFRASFSVGFSGTPRSFTERLMMEDARMNRGSNSNLPQ